MRAPLRFLFVLLGAGLLMAVPGRAADDYEVSPIQKDHWAWKRPVRSPLPAVKGSAWPRNPIDYFILAKLEAAGLRASPPADREQLLRRVSLDLIGLPPTPGEIAAFVHDPAPNAYEKVVDRLLASPHYGERWGRHWLDLARFAESNGYEHDEVRPDAWRYRDYVISSFNADKPYDRFVREQLAGDELYPDEPDALTATGFNLLGPDMTDTSDQAQRRQDTLNDMTDTAGLAFLGLTIACARCHDHKFEPIPQTDYYRLQAFFAPAVFRRDLPVVDKERRLAYEAALRDFQALVRPLQEEIARLEEPYRRKIYDAKLAKLSEDVQAAHRTPERQRTPQQQEWVDKTNRFLVISPAEVTRTLTEDDRAKRDRLQEQIKGFESRKPAQLPMAMGLRDNERLPKTFLLERGELANRGEEMQPGYPIILLAGNKPAAARIEKSAQGTGRRTALAEWMASKDNPLTARVLVNRLWQHHFGRGIVATASDFGVRGTAPTHPELLDWLAVDLVENGWSLKHLHRLMVLSATYQQASKSTQHSTVDPYNRLLWRMNRMRLEGEVIRDNLLAVGGRLNPRMGGPGVFPPLPPEVMRGFKSWPTSADPRDHVRRSVYVFARRNLRFPFLDVFDEPDSNLSCPKRERSTTAPQALALLNDADVIEAARALAERVTKEAAGTDAQIARAYCLALSRQPTATERRLAAEFLERSPLSELCRALFNLNEFVYRE
jgi:hypothetical protein